MESENVSRAKQVLSGCTEQDQRSLFAYLKRKLSPHPLEQEWNIDADTILTAIYRSPDLTRRGVRGILAEAVFERDVLPSIGASGWGSLPLPPGDIPYDFLVAREGRQVRIQLKLQRVESGQPKMYKPRLYSEPLYVVEVQKTRSGVRQGTPTRPYRFADFDILAVCMQPVVKRWDEFRYTVAGWLLPRDSEADLIEIFQPVSLAPSDVWTDRLETCLEWLLSGRARKVL